MKEPTNETALEQVALPDGSRVVLYEMASIRSHVTKNLVCYEDNGATRWTASPGQFGPDAFTDVHFDGELLRAYTWTGYVIWLDPSTGKEIRRVFTK